MDYVLVALIAAFPPSILAFIALWRANSIQEKLDEIHIGVNSRLTQLLEVTAKAAMTAGELKGRKEQHDASKK